MSMIENFNYNLSKMPVKNFRENRTRNRIKFKQDVPASFLFRIVKSSIDVYDTKGLGKSDLIHFISEAEKHINYLIDELRILDINDPFLSVAHYSSCANFGFNYTRTLNRRREVSDYISRYYQNDTEYSIKDGDLLIKSITTIDRKYIPYIIACLIKGVDISPRIFTLHITDECISNISNEVYKYEYSNGIKKKIISSVLVESNVIVYQENSLNDFLIEIDDEIVATKPKTIGGFSKINENAGKLFCEMLKSKEAITLNDKIDEYDNVMEKSFSREKLTRTELEDLLGNTEL